MFFIIRCLKFRQPDSCSRADQQSAANLVQVVVATITAAQILPRNARQAKPNNVTEIRIISQFLSPIKLGFTQERVTAG